MAAKDHSSAIVYVSLYTLRGPYLRFKRLLYIYVVIGWLMGCLLFNWGLLGLFQNYVSCEFEYGFLFKIFILGPPPTAPSVEIIPQVVV